jgi:hypothetical protein
MSWNIHFSRDATKQIEKLNKKVMSILYLLIEDLKTNGPAPGKQWPHYGKLKNQKMDMRHCHLIRGKPTYVCCWAMIDKQKKNIEVSYVGSHEKAPY